MGVTVRIEGADELRRVGSVLALDPTGRAVKLRIAAELRALAGPILSEQDRRVSAIPSHTAHAGASIRGEIQGKTSIHTRYVGRAASLDFVTRRTPGVRNFAYAPRRFNARKGFRHPVFGHDRWVTQQGDGGWFSEPIRAKRKEFMAAAWATLLAYEAQTIARLRAMGIRP